MNKEHWNSIYIGGKVTDEVVKQMIDMSYSIILNSLSKKVQKEIDLE
jgi:predicted DNA-binding protein (MmcQ/YjbR family)